MVQSFWQQPHLNFRDKVLIWLFIYRLGINRCLGIFLRKKKTILKRLGGIQLVMDRNANRCLLELERDLRDELNDIMAKEEKY